MNRKYHSQDMISLLKVFDENYAADDGYELICGLNLNKTNDAVSAIEKLIIPEYLSYSHSSKKLLLDTLDYLCESGYEFADEFHRIGFILELRLHPKSNHG